MVSDGMLSQDEIDALLKGSSETDEAEMNHDNLEIGDFLSNMEQDALGEIGNISFGSSATALSTLLNQKVDITTPKVNLIEKKMLSEEFPHPYVAIQVQYTEGFLGMNMLVIEQNDAAIIADLMLGGDGLNPGDLLGDIQLSAVQEAMNQMMGSAATSMSTIFNKKVDISPPSIDLLDFAQGEGKNTIPNEDLLVKISFRLKVGSLIDSNIMQLLPLPFAKSLVEDLMQESIESTDMELKESTKSAQADDDKLRQTHPEEPSEPDRQMSNPSASQLQSNIPAEPQYFGSQSMPQGQPVDVQPANFTNFQPYQLQETESRNLSMLMDIPLQVTVELGRTQRSVKEILELTPGSIVELDKLAGEPVDILVNNRLMAKGEVVVIEENFGVRVTDIVSPSDRINNLK
ncbi:flagellar motor switch phosphatase FliY [Bacillus massiliglaciei]|uniref:flagellar motor switch phosphatase FliY n=1 Tax=Bacillus massiliglaciei TaxID=1816693 RepID=UPI000A4C8986|nr:flagellar motor switch phosphatase FliY [Bacillus massiliglaciei]